MGLQVGLSSNLTAGEDAPFGGTGTGMTDALSPMMKVAGVAVLAGLMGGMLKPPQSYPADQFKNGPPPQGGF
jgi:hypothetical protein